MQIEGKTFVLAGQFKSGDKFITATQMIEMAGGKVKDGLGINKEVSYLVLGADGSPSWKDGICPQIAQAKAAEEKGQDIQIISEDELLDALANEGVTLEKWQEQYKKLLAEEKCRLKTEIDNISWNYDDMTKTLTIDSHTLPDLFSMIEDAEHVGLIEKAKSEQGQLFDSDNESTDEAPSDESASRDYNFSDMQKILPWADIAGEMENLHCPNLLEVPMVMFAWSSSLKSVDMPSVRMIGNSAFFECKSLEEVNMPNLISTGNGSFMNCRALKGTLTFPRLQHVGPRSFAFCDSLSGVRTKKPDRTRADGKTFKSSGSSLLSIGKAAFLNCVKLKNISFDEESCVIADTAFHRCESLNK